MKHESATVRTDSLSPGYKGVTIDFSWLPYDQRDPASKARMDRLRSHIKQHGIRNPLICFEHHVLIGMRRWEIAVELGIEQVSVVRLLEPVDHWRSQQVNQLRDWLRSQGYMGGDTPDF